MDQRKNKIVVSIVKLDSYEPTEVESAIQKLLGPLGGLESFVEKGDSPVIKPNFLWPSKADKAVCTHPRIIENIADTAIECGCSKVRIADSPGFGTAKKCASILGLKNGNNIEITNLNDAVDVTQSNDYKRLYLSRTLLEAKPLINIAKAKTHGQMAITAAVKNTFGGVVGLDKAQWHYRTGRNPNEFAKLIVTIHEMLKPSLSILDAVVGMEGNGPGSGTPRNLGFLMASTNAHALDLIFAEILDLKPESVFTLVAAKNLGLLPTFDNIEIKGVSPVELSPSPPWKMARPAVVRRIAGPEFLIPLLDRLISIRPISNDNLCISCGRCVESCASKAITIRMNHTGTKGVTIDRKKCISCFCCQEMCPVGAITVGSGPVARFLDLRRKKIGES